MRKATHEGPSSIHVDFRRDYVGSISVHLMTLAERGAYVLLLCLN